MEIRFGYAAIALNLPKVTTSSTITYSRYSKITSEKEKLEKLKSVTKSNLDSLEKVLNYNIENNIHFYRLTANLIPLSTHPDVLWDFTKYFNQDFKYIGNIIKNNNMRIDIHLDHFNVLNSLREEVVKSSLSSLIFYDKLLNLMNCEDEKIISHVGSSKNGKDESIKRFIGNFNSFPDNIKHRLIIENDDKTFNILDTLNLCKNIGQPMVLDYHHYICNNDGENVFEYIEDIFNTWNECKLIPKVHFSSPKEFEKDRKHADYIDVKEFIFFIDNVKKVTNRDFDVMIEAKEKDKALLKLIDDLKGYNQIEVIDESTIRVI